MTIMLKDKFLYRKCRSTRKSEHQYVRTNRNNDIDLFSDLPIHQAMNRKGYNYTYNNYNFRPLEEFISSKIGEDWNDVYSEIIKKIQPKYRYLLENDLRYIIRRPLYDDGYIPIDTYRSYRRSICCDVLYIDLNNIICYKSKDELISDSKRIIRKLKLQEIFDNEKESQSSD